MPRPNRRVPRYPGMSADAAPPSLSNVFPIPNMPAVQQPGVLPDTPQVPSRARSSHREGMGRQPHLPPPPPARTPTLHGSTFSTLELTDDQAAGVARLNQAAREFARVLDEELVGDSFRKEDLLWDVRVIAFRAREMYTRYPNGAPREYCPVPVTGLFGSQDYVRPPPLPITDVRADDTVTRGQPFIISAIDEHGDMTYFRSTDDRHVCVSPQFLDEQGLQLRVGGTIPSHLLP